VRSRHPCPIHTPRGEIFHLFSRITLCTAAQPELVYGVANSEMCGALACSVAYCGPRTARSAPQERAAVQMAVPLQTRRSALLLAATAPLALRQGVHALAYPQATHLVTTVYQPTVAACGQGERAIAGAAERLLLGQARRARWAWSLRRCRRCRRRACPRQTRARGATLWLTRRQCSGTAIS